MNYITCYLNCLVVLQCYRKLSNRALSVPEACVSPLALCVARPCVLPARPYVSTGAGPTRCCMNYCCKYLELIYNFQLCGAVV